MKYTQAVELHENGQFIKESFDMFEVSREFIWYVNYEKKNSYVIVPEGFKTNFGSIPRFLRFIFTPTRYLAYILHDALYTEGIYIQVDNYMYTPSRKQADKILRDALEVEGAGFIERNLIYLGVRIGGFKNYAR